MKVHAQMGMTECSDMPMSSMFSFTIKEFTKWGGGGNLLIISSHSGYGRTTSFCYNAIIP